MDSFFRWLEDPVNGIVFFSVAVLVCWGGTALLRHRRTAGLGPARPGRLRAYRAATSRRGAAHPARSTSPARTGLAGQTRAEDVVRPGPPLSIAADEALPLTSWWHQIADSPVTAMIIGESQSGKSTTARALLAWRARTDRIVIIDPHERFNDWGGLQAAVIGRDRDIEQVTAAFAHLHREFERRFRRGEEVGQGLTVFIDELPAIVAQAPEVAGYLTAWLLEGAKAGFRMVFLTQEPGVEALGLKGKGRVRLSTRKVLLGAFAADVPGALSWPAAIEVAGRVKSIDASALPSLAAQAASIDPAVGWLTPAELVRNGLGMAPASPFTRTGPADSEAIRDDTNTVEDGSSRFTDDELMAELVRRGVSANRIHELLGGTRAVVLSRVRELRGQAS